MRDIKTDGEYGYPAIYPIKYTFGKYLMDYRKTIPTSSEYPSDKFIDNIIYQDRLFYGSYCTRALVVFYADFYWSFSITNSMNFL